MLQTHNTLLSVKYFKVTLVIGPFEMNTRLGGKLLVLVSVFLHTVWSLKSGCIKINHDLTS